MVWEALLAHGGMQKLLNSLIRSACALLAGIVRYILYKEFWNVFGYKKTCPVETSTISRLLRILRKENIVKLCAGYIN